MQMGLIVTVTTISQIEFPKLKPEVDIVDDERQALLPNGPSPYMKARS
jgi:hypothetical protein